MCACVCAGLLGGAAAVCLVLGHVYCHLDSVRIGEYTRRRYIVRAAGVGWGGVRVKVEFKRKRQVIVSQSIDSQNGRVLY